MISPSRLNLRRRNTSGVSSKDRPVLGLRALPGWYRKTLFLFVLRACSVSTERASAPVVPVKVAPPPPKGTPPLRTWWTRAPRSRCARLLNRVYLQRLGGGRVAHPTRALGVHSVCHCRLPHA